MPVEDLIAKATARLLSGLVYRAICFVLITLFVLLALYHLTAAGMVRLIADFGEIPARLIVGGLYLAAAAFTFGVLYVIRRQPLLKKRPEEVATAKDEQIALLVESATLGYLLARKNGR